MALELRDISSARSAGTFLGKAFVDDPVWRMFGPRGRAHRERIAVMFHIGEAAVGRLRDQAWVIGAYDDGELVGVILANPKGRDHSALYTLTRGLAFAFAGPGPTLRGIRFGTGLEAWEPAEPHVHCWFLATTSSAPGVGSALMRTVIARADALGVPCYLEATSEYSAQLYRLLGYRDVGVYTMSNGHPITIMQRPVSASRPSPQLRTRAGSGR